MEKDDLVKETARSWIVAACCCFCNLTFYGVSRLSGIMLVATTHTFHVSRASAAVPFSLGTAIRNLAGLFVGHLGHRFGVGPVVAVGCLLASLGSGLCFLAKDVLWLTVCWGGVFGFGFGLCTCLLPLAINQNFSKNLGTASGISYSGSYIGSFIFPPIVVWLLEAYALQGTFLIISGGVLNVLIAALLLTERKIHKRKAISNSSEDEFSTDSKSRYSSSTVQPYYIDVTETWKKNLRWAYMESQDNQLGENKYKQNFRHSTSSEDSPYFFQDSIYRNRFSENEYTSGRTCSNNSFPCSEINTRRCNLLPNLFKTSEMAFPRNGERDNASATQNVPRSIRSTSDSSLTCDTDCVHSTMCSDICVANNVDSIRGSAKQVPMTPRECSKQSLECKSFFKANLKAKYKLRLQKLKKVLVASLLKHRSPYLKDFIQTENVKLTSFRYLQPYLYPNSSSMHIPTKCFNLSSPQRILCKKNTIGKVDNSSSNFVVTVQGTRVRCNSLPVFGISGQLGLLSIINGTLLDKAKYIADSEKGHGRRMKANSCDVPHKKIDNSSHSYFPTSVNGDAILCHIGTKSNGAPDTYRSDNYQTSSNVLNLSPELLLKDKTEFKAQKRKDSSVSQSKSSNAGGCFLDWLQMFRKPMFVVIGFTMSIQTFMVVCVVTTIEDYARDVGIPENRTHYALMALSIANLVGTLTLGSITDRGLISRHRFMFLCFLGMSLSLVALSLLAVSLPSLLSIIVIYGLLESGVIITFPLLTKQFMKGQRLQALAIASSNVLSVPTVMLVPMLIGHFRDNIGSYAGLFQVLGATSLTCSLLWLVAPYICKKRKLKKALQQIIENC